MAIQFTNEIQTPGVQINNFSEYVNYFNIPQEVISQELEIINNFKTANKLLFQTYEFETNLVKGTKYCNNLDDLNEVQSSLMTLYNNYNINWKEIIENKNCTVNAYRYENVLPPT